MTHPLPPGGTGEGQGFRYCSKRRDGNRRPDNLAESPLRRRQVVRHFVTSVTVRRGVGLLSGCTGGNPGNPPVTCPCGLGQGYRFSTLRLMDLSGETLLEGSRCKRLPLVFSGSRGGGVLPRESPSPLRGPGTRGPTEVRYGTRDVLLGQEGGVLRGERCA